MAGGAECLEHAAERPREHQHHQRGQQGGRTVQGRARRLAPAPGGKAQQRRDPSGQAAKNQRIRAGVAAECLFPALHREHVHRLAGQQWKAPENPGDQHGEGDDRHPGGCGGAAGFIAGSRCQRTEFPHRARLVMQADRQRHQQQREQAIGVGRDRLEKQGVGFHPERSAGQPLFDQAELGGDPGGNECHAGHRRAGGVHHPGQALARDPDAVRQRPGDPAGDQAARQSVEKTQQAQPVNAT